MRLDRRIVWLLGLILLAVVLWLLLDEVLFPPLPIPAGVAPISK